MRPVIEGFVADAVELEAVAEGDVLEGVRGRGDRAAIDRAAARVRRRVLGETKHCL